VSVAELPLYMDRATCQRLLGLTRVDVERIFQRCPVHTVEGSRKVYVHRDDALDQVRRHEKDEIRDVA
jgi:hypothetical protein